MSRRSGFAGIVLSLLLMVALWSSALVIGAPVSQANPTARQQTIDALEQKLATLAANETTVASLNQALLATAPPIDVTGTLAAIDTHAAPYDIIRGTARAEVGAGPETFKAYFLDVPDGMASQMTTLRQQLTTRYQWKVEDISSAQMANIDPNDPNVSGQVLIIPGGSTPLSDTELSALQNYVAKGGDLVIFAGSLYDKPTSLATADNLNGWLFQDFGVKFNKDVVLDESQAFQSPLIPVTTQLDDSSFITTNSIYSSHDGLVFEVPNSIILANPTPINVAVTTLAFSSKTSYSKTNLQDVRDSKVKQVDDDAKGPFVLAASAENTQTHAHIVLLSSTSLASDDFASFMGIDNLQIAFNSIIWGSDFNTYFMQVLVPTSDQIETLVNERSQQTQTETSYSTATTLARIS